VRLLVLLLTVPLFLACLDLLLTLLLFTLPRLIFFYSSQRLVVAASLL
jgi:hypothetical protein